MATTPHKNIAAAADLSANKDRFVKFDGSGTFIAADAASKPAGIQTNKPASGETVGLAKVGQPARLILGGTVAAGDWLKPDANAAGIVAAADFNIAGAFALQAGVSGDIINVEPMSPITLSISP